MERKFLFAAAVCMLMGIFGCTHASQTADIAPVRNFSLEKYLGTWYEIARMPHRFERDLSDVKAEYTLRPDGKVKVVNTGWRDGEIRRIEGVAEMKKDRDLGELQVSFFRPFYGDYRIIYLTPDYQVSVVTSDTRDYLWVLARKPVVAPEQLRESLKFAEKCGFPIKLLQYPGGNVEHVIGR